MDVFIYKGSLLCNACGQAVCEDLDESRPYVSVNTDSTPYCLVPDNPDDLSSYDSDDYPAGPYSDGGGEADNPQHCGCCGLFLENPLTDEGAEYVRERLDPYISTDDSPIDPSMVADRAADDGWPTLAEWARFYDYLWE